MRPGTGRWLAPLGASAAVLAVFVVPGVVTASGTSRAGVGPQQPEPEFTPYDPITPSLPPDGADQDRGGPRQVDVIGYRVNGRDLVVFFTVDQRSGCSGAIQAPLVDERVGAVRVTLKRQPPAGSDEACTDRVPTSSVDITLDRPLGGRLLQDGTRGGSLVPPMSSLP
ncbi:hypothetical protein BH10ACT10_BH10ACT10_23330 [soil metagenome]